MPSARLDAIAYRSVDDLKPYERNARTHSSKQIDQIAASIRRFGFTNPVLVDGEGTILAGHGRAAAAKRLGMQEVPTLRLDHLNAAERRAYVLADNKIAANAGWDAELLRLELGALAAEPDLDFDVEITGFETPEIDLILGAEDAPAEEVEPAPPPPDPVSALCRPGDLWRLGLHRLLCGDARDPEALARLMAGERAAMAFIDPPYNVPVAGHVRSKGKTASSAPHREFAMASGEMDAAAFTGFLETSFTGLAGVLEPGALCYAAMDWRHLKEALAAGDAAFQELLNVCVWMKTNAGMGSLYRSQHELFLVYKAGSAAHPHRNNVELGRHGRNRTNVWRYAGVTAFGENRAADLADHPTVKPLALVRDAICDVTARGALVVDSFAGSGTTLLAAEAVGRRARALEIDALYCDVILKRWEAAGGEAPVLLDAAGGETPLADVRAARDAGAIEAGARASTNPSETPHA